MNGILFNQFIISLFSLSMLVHSKNKCGCMAANLTKGSGLCALCNNDILDWGPTYRPPENQSDALPPVVKKPLVHIETADEIIASIRKLDSKEIPGLLPPFACFFLSFFCFFPSVSSLF